METQLAVLNPDGSSLREVPTPVRVLGIDLGTTNSTVAEVVWEPYQQKPLDIRCIEVDQETTSGLYTHLIVPSAIGLFKGKEWIGEGAKRLHARAAEFGLELTRDLFLECKNDIGSRRTYHKAPDGYASASEVGAKVLRFLRDAAQKHDPMPIARTVITVPASFQAAQRIDTVNAAKLAGIPITGGDLLDEPVAAFIDYLLSNLQEMKGVFSEPKNLAVFDFGGGTCDVAVFRIGETNDGMSLQVSPLAVSRYHRLGGGDIDRAILYEALLPQLMEQNQLDTFALTYEDKKNIVEPTFMGVAEALKIGLCNEIARLQSLGRYTESEKAQVAKKQPGVHSCKIRDRVLQLHSPTLTATQFEEIMKDFLDQDLLYARETEYRLTCSIFAPIQDVLDRSNLDTSDIDLCLLVGGSSLIPPVVAALRDFFKSGQILMFPDRDAVQVATARGAAAHSLAMTLFGKSIFQLVAHDRISIRTAHGSYELVPKEALLPFPSADEWQYTLDLVVPETSLLKPVQLLVEILAGDSGQERSLLTATWTVPAPVNKGEKLRLEYRLDENQVLEFNLTLDGQPEAEPFVGRLENPISNVVNPNAIRLKIQKNEEELRTGGISKEKVPEKVVEIARDYAEIQQTEKAISYLKQALRLKNRPDPYILTLLGIYYGEIKDFQNEEKFYREAHAAGGGAAALFNLALSQYRQRKYEVAKETINDRMQIDTDGPGLTLASQIADALRNSAAKDDFIRQALSEFNAVRSADDWELGWLITAARVGGETERMEEAIAEQRRRRTSRPDTGTVTGVLPEIAGTLRKV